jgi:hypothetical protein
MVCATDPTDEVLQEERKEITSRPTTARFPLRHLSLEMDSIAPRISGSLICFVDALIAERWSIGSITIVAAVDLWGGPVREEIEYAYGM